MNRSVPNLSLQKRRDGVVARASSLPPCLRGGSTGGLRIRDIVERHDAANPVARARCCQRRRTQHHRIGHHHLAAIRFDPKREFEDRIGHLEIGPNPHHRVANAGGIQPRSGPHLFLAAGKPHSQ
jgi:hypothetical protein